MIKTINLKFDLLSIRAVKSIQYLEEKIRLSSKVIYPNVSIVLAVITANLISLGCFIALRASIAIEYKTGCEGPETFFAMIPAVLLCIYLRMLHRN